MAFVMPARYRRDKRRALLHIKGANSFGAVELVSRYGEEINTQGVDMNGNFAYSLNGICGEDIASCPAIAPISGTG